MNEHAAVAAFQSCTGGTEQTGKLAYTVNGGIDWTAVTFDGDRGEDGMPDSDGTLSTGTLARACVPNSTGSLTLGADVDSDGVRDLMTSWRAEFTDALGAEHGMDYIRCVLPSSRLALGGRIEVGDVSLCYHGGRSTTADPDGDGLAEIIGVPQDAVTTYETPAAPTSSPASTSRGTILPKW